MTEIAESPAVGASPRRAAKDIVTQLVMRLLNVALGIAVTIILVRALGDDGFGVWSTIFAITQIVGYFGDLGLEQIAVRKAAEEPHREREWLSGLVTLRMAITVPATIACFGIVLLIENERDAMIAGALLCGTLLIAGLSSARAVFQLRIRNGVNAGIELANGVLWAIAVIVIASQDGGIVAFAAAFLITYTITTCAQVALALRERPLRIAGARDYWPELARIGIPVAVSGLLIIAYGRIDQVLVFEINGESGAGLYGAAFRLIDRAYLLPATVMTTMFPLIAAAHGVADGQRVRRLIESASDILLLAALPVFAFSIPAADEIVSVLFGPDFAGIETTLVVMMGTFVLTSLGFLCGYLVIVLELQKRFVRFALAALVFNVGANLILLPEYGYEAAAWVMLGTQALVIGLSARAISGRLGYVPAPERPIRMALAAALMGAAVYGVDQAGAPFAVLVALAVVIYPLLVLALRAVSVEDLRRLLPSEGAAS